MTAADPPTRASVLSVLPFLLAVACRPVAEPPRPSPVAANRPALQAMLEEVTGETARPFMTYDFGRGREPRAISVIVPRDSSLELVSRLRSRIPTGWLVFVGTHRWLGDEDHGDSVELVVGPGSDQFDILRLARTDAVNYDMMTEALIQKLRAYDDAVGLDLLQANTDTVVARINRLPADLTSFAQDVYGFCPDVVDQGVGSVDALQTELRRSRMLYLWWD